MQTIDPSTKKPLASYPLHSREDVDSIIDASLSAQKKWAELSIEQRAVPMRKLAELLRKEAEAEGRQITEEMGKPIREAIKEVQKCATACDYYAEHAAKFLADELVDSGSTQSLITYAPLGIIFGIMPWNFPYWQVLRCAAPTLMAGNAFIFKHAPNVTGCALAIEALCKKAGLPEDLVRCIVIEAEASSEWIADPRIAAVTLTGSGRAGRSVAAQAGAALKKSVLELGGSDPFIVLEDADLEAAVTGALTGRLMNSGQSCIASKRFLVAENLVDGFCSRIKEALLSMRMGNPMDDDTDIGPLAREDLRSALHKQVQHSVELGAECLCGGQIPELDGWYYPPTLLRGVKPGMPAFDEETFGPVFAIIAVKSAEEALQLANLSRYGLGASIWTSNPQRGLELGRRVESGAVFINGNVHSHPALPFGGVKESGYGRELSKEGIREFVNIKPLVLA